MLSLLFAVLSVVLFVDGIINVLHVPFVKSVLRASALQFGWLAAAQGAGAVVGSLVLGLLGTRMKSARMMVIGLEVAGVLFLVEANVPVFPLISVLVLVTAGPIVGINVGASSLLQSAVEDRYRGRVFGSLGATLSLATLCGIGVGSSLGTTIGIARAFDVAGGMYIAAGLTALLLLRSAPST